jgi:hypothetical protein
VKNVNLETIYPKLKEQFCTVLNKDIRFEDLTIGSRKEVWWRCNQGPDHVWKTSVNQRTSGKKLRGCAVCTGKVVVNSTSLATTHQDIASEWHYEKNSPLTPYQITGGSNKEVWWKCIKDSTHTWVATTKNRTRNNNTCPNCNSLGYKYPEISKQWHPIKNGQVSPFEVSYSSHTRYWWKCEKGFDHVWETSPNSRTGMNTDCPVCSGHKVVKSNSLATVYPEISLQWDFERNGSLKPDDIFCKSSKKVWWKCKYEEDHRWRAMVKSRANDIGCPMCSGRKVVKSNSLGTRYPDIAKLWNGRKNGDLTQFEVTPFANRVVWWKCPEGEDHEWAATVANIVNGSGCPVCINRKITDSNNLFALFPKIAEEWDFEKNIDVDPLKTAAGSHLKVWWKCKRDNEHQWFSTIKDRTSKNSGCPICSIKLNVSETNMLEIIKGIFDELEVRYRYKPKWLNRLELDVYIPNLKLAFEYQGIQHFKPIDFFGGEETFVAQVQRDKIKKEVCDEKEITLIYVYYNEVLSENLIKDKLADAGIPF